MDCDLEIKMQNLPCFDKNLCFGVLEGLRTCKLVFLTLGNVQNLFEMFTNFGFNRYKSCVDFAS